MLIKLSDDSYRHIALHNVVSKMTRDGLDTIYAALNIAEDRQGKSLLCANNSHSGVVPPRLKADLSNLLHAGGQVKSRRQCLA